MGYDPSRILRELDLAADACDFPMLDNQNFDPAGVRLSGFSDCSHCGLFIEVLWSNAHKPGAAGLCDSIISFGNCLRGAPSEPYQLDFLHSVDDGPEVPLFDVLAYSVNRNAKNLLIRGKLVPIVVDADTYRREGIPVDLAPEVSGDDFLRWLAPRYRDLLFATDEELYSRMTVRLPLILRLDEWHHPDLARGEKPSDTECFQQIAEVLATGDPSRYRPTEPPNTHWSNWLNK